MLTIFWIFFIGIPTNGYGLDHRIRHERTRYVSGKNQIYASGYVSKETSDQNGPQFISFWERPLQVLESSMNVPKKSFSRPLFSWDVPQEKINMEMKNEIDSNLESRTESTEDPLKLIRSGRKYWVKDPSTLPTTYAYFSTAAKKKSVNRKNPANKLTKSRKREGHGNGIEATTQKIRRKKKGKKNGKGKGEGRKTKIFKNSTETNLNVAVDSKNLSIQKEEPKNVFPANDLSLATAPISPCNLMEEKCEHRCRDVNGTAVCVCFKGFFSAGTKCLDINECELNDGGCNGKCINTIGSRKCICSRGYRLVEGICKDVNECLLRNGHGPCQHHCVNTVGSYRCDCEGLPGTRLSSDQLTCERVNSCDPATEGCSHSCVSTSGRTFCTCPDGLELGDDWKTCHDIDECLNPDDHGVDCESKCVNTIGSYRCSTGNETVIST